MNERIEYWVDIAEYDYETAVAMLNARRFLYVGFMCHQVIEKMLKAYWSKVLEEPPLKIHTLSRLAERSGIKEMMTHKQWEFIIDLQPLNIEARYPEYKNLLLKKLSTEYCQMLLQQTNELRQWIREKL